MRGFRRAISVAAMAAAAMFLVSAALAGASRETPAVNPDAGFSGARAAGIIVDMDAGGVADGGSAAQADDGSSGGAMGAADVQDGDGIDAADVQDGDVPGAADEDGGDVPGAAGTQGGDVPGAAGTQGGDVPGAAGTQGGDGADGQHDGEVASGSVDDLLGDFDADADFGGLALEPGHGPGVVEVSVYNTDGKRIEGVRVTEDGFGMEERTPADAPLVVEGLPFGERGYGVEVPYSYEYVSGRFAYYLSAADAEAGSEPAGIAAPSDIVGASGSEEGPGSARVEAGSLAVGETASVVISETAQKWEYTVVLREVMRMKADYYIVSPNDRFYPLTLSADAPQELRESPPEEGDFVPYAFNVFDGAPARIAIHLQMPNIREVTAVELYGEGFGGVGSPYVTDGEASVFSQVDWTKTEASWQLLDSVTDFPEGDGATGERVIVFALGESRDGDYLRLDGVRIHTGDGGVIDLPSPTKSDVRAQIVDMPKLQ